MHTLTRMHHLCHQANPQKPQIRPHHLGSAPTDPHPQNGDKGLSEFQEKFEPPVPDNHHLHVRHCAYAQAGQMHPSQDKIARRWHQ